MDENERRIALRLEAEGIDYAVGSPDDVVTIIYVEVGNGLQIGIAFEGEIFTIGLYADPEQDPLEGCLCHYLEEVLAVYRSVSAATDQASAIAACYLADNEIVEPYDIPSIIADIVQRAPLGSGARAVLRKAERILTTDNDGTERDFRRYVTAARDHVARYADLPNANPNLHTALTLLRDALRELSV